MPKYARLYKHPSQTSTMLVCDVIDHAPEGWYHPDVAKLFVPIPDNVDEDWRQKTEGTTVTWLEPDPLPEPPAPPVEPEPVPPPEPVTPPPPTNVLPEPVAPYGTVPQDKFRRMFTFAEWATMHNPVYVQVNGASVRCVNRFMEMFEAQDNVDLDSPTFRMFLDATKAKVNDTWKVNGVAPKTENIYEQLPAGYYTSTDFRASNYQGTFSQCIYNGCDASYRGYTSSEAGGKTAFQVCCEENDKQTVYQGTAGFSDGNFVFFYFETSLRNEDKDRGCIFSIGTTAKYKGTPSLAFKATDSSKLIGTRTIPGTAPTFPEVPFLDMKTYGDMTMVMVEFTAERKKQILNKIEVL